MSGFNWRTKPMIMYEHCLAKTETFKDAVRNQVWSRTLKTLKWTHRMYKIFTNMDQCEYLAVSPFCKLALCCVLFIIRIVYDSLYELYTNYYTNCIRFIIRIVYESHTNCIRITYECHTNCIRIYTNSKRCRYESIRIGLLKYRIDIV